MEETTLTNAQAVREFFNALDRKDLDAASSNWAVNHQLYFPSGGTPMNTEVHKGMSQMFMTGFPDFKHEIQDTLESGNKVVARGFFTGTHLGEFNGIPATGKTVRVSWIDISEFDSDGKVVNEWIEMDSTGMLQQLGLMPSPTDN
jgi:steroid delta-isomerase-like uncharacterized protein